jgi:hypothetical protein
MNLFSPKDIILNAIKDKLIGTGVEKITVVFDLFTDTYNLLFTDQTGHKMNIDLNEKDISMVKKIFINKLIKQYKKTSDKEIKSVIIRINFDQGTEVVTLKLFIETIDKNVEQLNY